MERAPIQHETRRLAFAAPDGQRRRCLAPPQQPVQGQNDIGGNIFLVRALP